MCSPGNCLNCRILASTYAWDSFSVARATSHAALLLERDAGSVGRGGGQLGSWTHHGLLEEEADLRGDGPAVSPPSGKGWREGADMETQVGVRSSGLHEQGSPEPGLGCPQGPMKCHLPRATSDNSL